MTKGAEVELPFQEGTRVGDMKALAQYDERAPSAIVSEAISSQSRLVLADLRLFGLPTSAVEQGYHHGKNFSDERDLDRTRP